MTSKKKEKKALVRGDMTIQDIIKTYPLTLKVFSEYDLLCAMCHMKEVETLSEGTKKHGFTDEQYENLLEDLNDVAEYNVVKEEKNNFMA